MQPVGDVQICEQFPLHRSLGQHFLDTTVRNEMHTLWDSNRNCLRQEQMSKRWLKGPVGDCGILASSIPRSGSFPLRLRHGR